jgi:hypothetical protein
MADVVPDWAAVQELLDRQRIADCMNRYARGVDRVDVELIRSAYWPDAHDSHGPFNGPLDVFLDGWVPLQQGRDVAHHLLGNHYVELDGDTADAETYFLSAAKLVGRDDLELVAGRYLDRFERRAGEWRILSRLVVLDWQCVTDASGMAERLARSHRGARGTDDPSYERPVARRSAVDGRRPGAGA